MELQVSSRVVAQLVSRLMRTKLTPIAESAARYERRTAAVFLRVVKMAQDAVPMHDLEGVLGLHGGWGAALYIVDDAVRAFGDALMGEEIASTHHHVTHIKTLEAALTLPSVLGQTAQAAARVALRALHFSMSFDAVNPAAVAWAHDYAALLITQMTDDVKDAIRLTVVQGFEDGIPPRDLARLIRSHIGLTSRDAAAVMKRQLQMLSDGASQAKALVAAQKYADKLIRSRALTIARTETLRASNEGQRILWNEAQKSGLLSATAQKVWITADPCPICAPLEGETVGLNESFSIGSDPPAHPRCRCVIGLS